MDRCGSWYTGYWYITY
jgi:hypothetical protein